MASPFDTDLRPHVDDLPSAFREQFLTPADAPYEIVLNGEMDNVWHRPRWLWPLFWLSARFDMLFPETGIRVPAAMVIAGGKHRDGRPYQTWQRTFRFPKPRRFNATMEYDERAGQLIELLGPANALRLEWGTRFAPPLTIEIWTKRAALRAGRLRLPLPRWLTGTVRVVERADAHLGDTIHVDLTISHTLFGQVFGYTGTFQLRRRAREVANGGL